MSSTIVSSPLDTEVVIGNSVSISCSASGVPLPNIIWSRAGHGEIMNHTDYLITSVEDNDSMLTTSLLTIVNAVQVDTGYYNCTAENNIGRDFATFFLQVQGMSVVESLSMQFTFLVF